MAEALVTIEGLEKKFVHMGRELHVLKGIDLNIYRGQILSIVGPSGAGKSTLLHIIGTLDLPTAGKIRLGGEELTTMDSRRLAAVRNRDIGFVFQFHHLLPEFDALENVMLPGLIQGRPRRDMEKRAKLLLDEVGLGHRGTHRPGELSGGEQQRVAVARALALEPKLVLADEPTGNLDTATSDAIHDLFFHINKEHGTTIIVVTHNVAFAESMPRVVRMLDGRVAKDDNKSESGSAAGEGQGYRSASDPAESALPAGPGSDPADGRAVPDAALESDR
ncbi:MAG TPA: ABC transporter ATP-binding protein [Polyangiaceae bacterium]|nr:ABC transporter ATP-binding protein [Polyangiaceae bacterium]